MSKIIERVDKISSQNSNEKQYSFIPIENSIISILKRIIVRMLRL